MDRDNKCTVWCQCENCTHNYSQGIKDTEDLREVCPKGVQRRSERKTLSWQQGDGRADQFRSRSSWCSGDLRWKLDLLQWPRDQETEFPVEACWLSQTQESKSTHKLLMIPFFLIALAWFTCTGFPLERQWTKDTMLRTFKGVQEKIPSEEASTLQIGSVAFPTGQCTSPQLHPCHRLLEQDGH